MGLKKVNYFSKVYNQYVRNANKRDLEFNLDIDTFIKLVLLNCHYCGCEPSKIFSDGKKSINPVLCNGIDRLDSKVGYTINNSVPCCHVCNRAKMDMGVEEFYEWITRIHNKQVGY